MAKGTLQMQLKIVKWGEDPGLSVQARCNKYTTKGKRDRRVRGQNIQLEGEVGVMALWASKMKGDHKPRDMGF